ncbi:MAG: DNA replication and repair protein RecF [Kofleriaceae bacterium]|nr:DNA replication and repair protein RecF [Kofleriaceae bacterium]
MHLEIFPEFPTPRSNSYLRRECLHWCPGKREGIERRYELTINQRSRIVRLDNKAVRPISRYFGQFNIVLFAPEDLLVARGSPSDRRKFLDRAVFNLAPDFLPCAQDYEKVLKNRNLTLKSENMGASQKEQMLEVYDSQLASLAAKMLRARIDYLKAIGPLFEQGFESITRTGLPAKLIYQPAGDIEAGSSTEEELIESYQLGYQKNRAMDLARGSTSLGPHRDNLHFELASQPAANFASQGQLRAMILAWKTAEMQLLASVHNDPPVLLLDDVSSELDPIRNEYLFDFLRQRENQCFITTTHPDFVLLREERCDFSVEDGVFSRISEG